MAYSELCRQTRPFAPRVADCIATQLPQLHRLPRHCGLPFWRKRHFHQVKLRLSTQPSAPCASHAAIRAWTRKDVGGRITA